MATRPHPYALSLVSAPRPSSVLTRPTVVAIIALVAGGAWFQVVAIPASADALVLDAAEARARGVAFGISRRMDLPGHPVVVTDDPPDRSRRGLRDGRTLLDVSRDGELAALAETIGPDATELVLARADGAQLRRPMAGILAGTFSPAGEDLAVIDGVGRLQLVSTADGSMREVADGPFLGPISIGQDGGIILLAVSSVEAPFSARLGRVDPERGAFVALDEGELVYSGTLLDDGSVAAVAHDPTGSIVRRDRGAVSEVLATLPPGAIHVAVSPDGTQIAWERSGEGVYLRAGDGIVRTLGTGARPRFAPNGGALLVDDAGEATLIDTATAQRIPLGTSTAAFARCPAGCAS